MLICIEVCIRFLLAPSKQYFSYILAVIWCMQKPKPTLLLTQWIFNRPPHIGTGLWWGCKLYTAGKSIRAHINVTAMTGFIPQSPGSPTQCPNQLSYFPTQHIYLTGVAQWAAEVRWALQRVVEVFHKWIPGLISVAAARCHQLRGVPGWCWADIYIYIYNTYLRYIYQVSISIYSVMFVCCFSS